MSWAPGVVRIDNPHLLSGPDPAPCRTFLERAFGLEEVRSIAIDRTSGSALIRYAPRDREIGAVLDRLAAALRGQVGPTETPVPLPDGEWARVTVSRYGAGLSLWELVHELPGRARFRHERLHRDATLGQRLARELVRVHGVESCEVRPRTASVLVYFDPAILSTRHLVELLDLLLQGPALALGHSGDPPPVPFELANSSVGLAALGEFVSPIFLPFSALLLIASNLKTFREAYREVRQRQFGLPVLATTIIAATLASGGFLAASLMGWMVKFWHRQHRERLLAARRRLFPGLAQHGRFARLCVGDTLVEVPLERVQPGDALLVVAGEFVPADGRVVGGSALLDERLIRGARGLTRAGVGDPALAGARVVTGEIRVEVAAVGATTRAVSLAGTVLAATTPPTAPFAVTEHAEAFARRTVVPTLATAGLGLLVGDLNTAAAVLRPDYATGPGLGVALEQLEDIAACAQEGILIRDPAALARLAEADLILLDDHPALERPALRVEVVTALGDDPHEDLLRYAAAALRDLDDERATALAAACAARGLTPFDLVPDHLGPGILLHHAARRIVVADDPMTVRDGEAEGSVPPSLTVTAEGRTIGRIAFRRDGPPEAAAAIRDLRRTEAVPIGMLSSRPGPEAERWAAELGADLVRGDLSPESRIAVLRWYRERGTKVAFVGAGSHDSRLLHEAHVTIALADRHEPEESAAIVLLRGDLARLAGLRARARSHVARVRAVHGATLIPNLACIVGAFFFGFTSLSSVIVTNLGVLSVYSRLPHRSLPGTRALARPAREEQAAGI